MSPLRRGDQNCVTAPRLLANIEQRQVPSPIGYHDGQAPSLLDRVVNVKPFLNLTLMDDIGMIYLSRHYKKLESL
jgi:hypothetical protein